MGVSKDVSYFITFTCHDWIPLIEHSEAYDSFYKWFNYLRKVQVDLLAYVIMPNHFHGILHLPEQCDKSINKLISNGKRFLAYDIISRLKERKMTNLIERISSPLSEREKKKGQKHKVFKESFDATEITSLLQLYSVLDYMHHNPCQGKWNLSHDFVSYSHSSAAYYELNKPNIWIRDFRDIFGEGKF